MATGITAGNSLNPTLQTYFEKMALDTLEANLFFQQTAKHEEIPANSGLTYDTYRYSKIASDTSTLSEGVVPTEVELSASTIAVTLAQFGQFVIIPDLSVAAHRTNTIPDAVTELAYAGAKSIDEVVRAEYDTAAVPFLVNGRAAIVNILAADTADMADIRKMVRDFKVDDVHSFVDGLYAGYYHPNVMHDLRSNTAAGEFIEVTQNTSDNARAKIARGEIGQLWQTSFRESSQITSAGDGDSGTTVYRNFMIGKNALIDVELANMPFQLFVKGLGTAGSADPLNQRASVGYKFTYGAKYVGTDAAKGRAKKFLCAASA